MKKISKQPILKKQILNVKKPPSKIPKKKENKAKPSGLLGQFLVSL